MSDRAHLLVLVVTLVSELLIIRLVRRRQLRAKYSILWISVGVVLVVLAASPRILDNVSLWLGIYYGPATFFLGSTTLLFLLTVHFSWELSRLEDRTRTTAEEIALLRLRIDDLEKDAAAGAERSDPLAAPKKA